MAASEYQTAAVIMQPGKLAASLKKVLVSYKPDHGLPGKFFDETVPGRCLYMEKVNKEKIRQDDIHLIINSALRESFCRHAAAQGWKRACNTYFNTRQYITIQKPWFVTRKKLIICTERDIARIINPEIRLKVEKKIEKAADDQKRRILLEEFIAETGIRCEYKEIFVSRYEAMSYKKEQTKPRPAAKFICRLFKNDTLKIGRGAFSAFYVRVAGFATTQQKIDIRPLHAAQNIPQWYTNTSTLLTESFWADKKNRKIILP